MYNIKMDARCLFPRGYHPIAVNKEPDGVTEAHGLTRIDKPLKYYLVDFSEAVQVEPGEPCIVAGPKGSYDAFKVDIYSLGEIYYRKFTQWVRDSRCIVPLIC